MTAPWDRRGHTYLIAELGACHQGSAEMAHRMIDVAAAAGCDAVKAQKRCLTPGALFSDAELARPYAGPHSFGATYGEHRAALELGLEVHAELRVHALELGLDYGLSVWDAPSVAEAIVVDVSWLKVPSAAAHAHGLLRTVARTGAPVILSTGGCTSGEVIAAVTTLHDAGVGDLAVLQCTSAYPCPMDAIDLRVLTEDVWGGHWNGVSGHWNGIAVDCAAVALGARIIERHMTLDRTARGTDHAAALEPGGVRKWVRDVRAVEAALGSRVKRVHPCEEASMGKLRTEALRR